MTLVVLTGAVSLVAGACSSGGDAGLAVTEVAADVEFGAADEPVPGPANFNPRPVTPRQAASAPPLPDFALPPPPTAPGSPPSGPAPSERPSPCPPAEAGEFPDVSAPRWMPSEHKELPREGVSRWHRSGVLRLAAAGGREVEIGGFEQRVVREVDVESEEVTADGRRTATAFSYETVQPEVGSGNVVISRFQVRSDAQSLHLESPLDESEVGAGEPGRGLALTEIEVRDPEGGRVSGFAPESPLLLLPLPVVPGEAFQSAAVDARSGQQIGLDGRVIRRERIDACGDVVEAWLVRSQVASSGGGAEFTRRYDYLVATQYGAVLVREKIDQGGEGELHLEFTLAQQDPDPPPEGTS